MTTVLYGPSYPSKFSVLICRGPILHIHAVPGYLASKHHPLKDKTLSYCGHFFDVSSFSQVNPSNTLPQIFIYTTSKIWSEGVHKGHGWNSFHICCLWTWHGLPRCGLGNGWGWILEDGHAVDDQKCNIHFWAYMGFGNCHGLMLFLLDNFLRSE